MSRNVAMVMDLGGTKIKLGLVENSMLLSVAHIDSHSQNGLAERLPVIKELMDALLQQHHVELKDIAGAGIAIPGIVDSKQKKILSIDNKFNDAPSLDLSAWINECWQTTLQLENDARAALIGEWQCGKGKGYNDVVLMTIGTGVGSSAVIEGKVLTGKHFQAGCLGGHFTINLHGEKCNCGNYGCVEIEGSTWNIERKAKTNENYESSSLSGESKIDFESVFRLADEGDSLSINLRDQCVNVWSACAVNLIHAYDPEVLIIGGGVMASADFIIPYIQQKVNENAWTPWGNVQIVAAENINTAALMGAGYLVFNT